MTLVELLLAATLMAVIATAAASAMWIFLESHAYATSRSALYREGILMMERMTNGVRKSTAVMVPNAHAPVRDVLAFSGTVNDDNDYYFNENPLLPRIDEDPGGDMTADASRGIVNIDDDGDGTVDEAGSNADDDEDGVANEETLNGKDDDGDGNIDEDLDEDINLDGASGFLNFDDDGDGTVDNGASNADDDEDGANNEDPFNPSVYWFDGANVLNERDPIDGTDRPLSTHVSNFQVTFDGATATHAPRLMISLTLADDNGETVTFTEWVYPRNTIQKTGKRVR